MDKSKKAVKRRKFLQNVACFSVVACSSSAIVAGVTCSILYSKLEPVERQYFSLVLDAGSGQFENGNHAVSFDIQLKTTWKEIQEQQMTPSPTYVGHGFTGWVINGEAIPDDYVFLEDTVVNATYSVNKIALSFANQPELEVKEGDVTLPTPLTSIRYGMNWSDVKKSAGKQLFPSVRGGLDLEFADYYVDHDHNPKTDKIRIADSYVFDGDTELEAHYNAKIKFQNATDSSIYGNFDYVDATFPVGTVWGTVNKSASEGARKKYEPWLTNEAMEDGVYFDYYTEGGKGAEHIEPNYKISHPTSFHAFYDQLGAKYFEEDVWATFLREIEGKTFDELVAGPYAVAYQEPISHETYHDRYKVKDTFVGLRRTIVANGYEFTIRVVDENRNWSPESENDWHFLFEFENIVSIPMPFNSIDIDTQYQNVYFDTDDGLSSNLDYNLQNTLFEWFPTKIQEYWTKSSNRNYNVKYWNSSLPGGTSKIQTINRNIFAPSAIELGFETFPDYGGPILPEGRPLPFYANIKENEERSKAEEIMAEFRQKKFVVGSEQNHAYWLRTPDITTTVFSWGINQKGTLGYEYEEGKYEPYVSVEDILYISPIIAI